MAITDKDIDKIEKRFLDKFATKDDLKGFATKQDLEDLFDRMFKTFATKQDLEQYVTKTEFSDFKDDTFKHFDNIYGVLKTMQEEMTFMRHRVYDNHENRIKKLEIVQNIVSD